MKISLSWLCEYVQIDDIPLDDLCHGMTMSGSIVEGCEVLYSDIQNVVVGRILSTTPHPNAERLTVCEVDVGARITIVTAAKNVTAGQLVPVALDGSTLHGGMKISNADMRGITSEGMFCSYAELGIDARLLPGAPADGILILSDLDVLPPDTPLGCDVLDAMGLRETVLEFEITPNRPDCMSVIGIAREAAATFNRALTLPRPTSIGGGGAASDLLSVTIDATDLCAVYSGRVVKNARIAPSPWLYRKRLSACGLRPINNMVDITNYIMLLYGQPMHAFDHACLEGGEIIVRRATSGETIQTLDGSERALCGDMLVIADAHRPSAVAGVMGGFLSEITDKTSTIVFEAALFDGDSIRATSNALGMRTDSSALFEKCLTAAHINDASDMACMLVEEFGAGTVCDGHVTATARDAQPVTISPDTAKINALLGTSLSSEQIFDILARLGFTRKGDAVVVPPYRGDITMQADLAEETARIYGYENLPTTMANSIAKHAGYNERQKSEAQIQSLARSLGYNEILTYSFISPSYFDKLALPADSPLRRCMKIINPMGEDTSVMRTTALGSAIAAAARNRASRVDTARLYELAKVFIPTDTALPSEQKRLALAAYGGIDFYGFKGDIESILSAMRVNCVKFSRLTDDALFHPGRAAVITIGSTVIGKLGELHPTAAENYDLDLAVYAAELDFELLYANIAARPTYTPVPRFPAAARDLAVVVDRDIQAGDLLCRILSSGGPALCAAEIFDVYIGTGIPDGQKSVAFALSFRSDERTLKDAEVEAAMSDIISALQHDFDAHLRG